MGNEKIILVVNIIRNFIFMGITEVPIWLSRYLNASGETVLRACFTRSQVCRFGDHSTLEWDACACNSPAGYPSSAVCCWCYGGQLSGTPASDIWSAVLKVAYGTAADLSEKPICEQSPESALWGWGQSVTQSKKSAVAFHLGPWHWASLAKQVN